MRIINLGKKKTQTNHFESPVTGRYLQCLRPSFQGQPSKGNAVQNKSHVLLLKMTDLTYIIFSCDLL